MNEEDVLKYATIKRDGSILLGNHTVCDGADPKRKIGIFTHIHRDHTELLNQAMHQCSQIYVSLPTLDLLAALDQDYSHSVSAECYFKGRHIHPLDFNTRITPKIDDFSTKPYYGDKITLFESNHILGSCQVLVEAEDGTRIAYTGDFTSGTKPIPCDILVLDSTHGDPMFNTVVDRASLENRLIEYVDQEIQNSKNILIRAHRGRLQYTMHLLSEALPNQVKFLAHPTDIKLISVYKKYKMSIRDCISFKSYMGEDIQEGNSTYVEFRSHGQGANILEGTEKMAVFNLGGRFLGGGTVLIQSESGSYYLEFMDHADFSTILDYVKQSNPKYVVTDFVRGKQGKKLAEQLEKEGFKAISLPFDE